MRSVLIDQLLPVYYQEPGKPETRLLAPEGRRLAVQNEDDEFHEIMNVIKAATDREYAHRAYHAEHDGHYAWIMEFFSDEETAKVRANRAAQIAENERIWHERQAIDDRNAEAEDRDAEEKLLKKEGWKIALNITTVGLGVISTLAAVWFMLGDGIQSTILFVGRGIIVWGVMAGVFGGMALVSCFVVGWIVISAYNLLLKKK